MFGFFGIFFVLFMLLPVEQKSQFYTLGFCVVKIKSIHRIKKHNQKGHSSKESSAVNSFSFFIHNFPKVLSFRDTISLQLTKKLTFSHSTNFRFSRCYKIFVGHSASHFSYFHWKFLRLRKGTKFYSNTISSMV